MESYSLWKLYTFVLITVLTDIHLQLLDKLPNFKYVIVHVTSCLIQIHVHVLIYFQYSVV